MSFTVAWIIWLAATIVTFGVLELMAIRQSALARSTGGVDQRGTLSENLRRWLGVDPPRPWRRVAAAAFASGLTALVNWLVPHIVG